MSNTEQKAPAWVVAEIITRKCPNCGRHHHKARMLKRIQETYPLYCFCGYLLYGEEEPVEQRPASPTLALIQKRVSECLDMATPAAIACGDFELIGDAVDAASIFGRLATSKEHTEEELQVYLNEVMRFHTLIKNKMHTTKQKPTGRKFF